MTACIVRSVRLGSLLGVLLFLCAACGGGGDDHDAAPTPTPVAGATVSGLLVVGPDVAAGPAERLGVPPPEWAANPDAPTFDRALTFADLSLGGEGEPRMTTGSDGSFELAALPPGQHSLDVTRTLNGNLLDVTVPFAVGADGTATIVAELAWGLVKATSTYSDGGVPVVEVYGPYGTRLVARDGRITLLADSVRTLTDTDGDGQFDQNPCLAGAPVCSDGDPSCLGQTQESATPCTTDADCREPGGRCVCVPSCPQCDDCVKRTCAPGCGPVTITGITVSGSAQLLIGQTGQVFATAELSNGSTVDVTHLADWRSSDGDVVTVDSWGTVTARGVGAAAITAVVGEWHSADWPVKVTERPALRGITIQDPACWCGPVFRGGPAMPGDVPPCLLAEAPPGGDILPMPNCQGVLRIGATRQFTAVAEFGDGVLFEDVTARAEWRVEPSAVGKVAAGLFTAVGAGTGAVSATLDGVSSEPLQIKVVEQPTIEFLSIYGDNYAYVDLAKPSEVPGGVVGVPCADCEPGFSVLRGDKIPFRATARYDTGEWEDVTARVTWRSSATDVAVIDAGGVLTAVAAGAARVDALLGTTVSNAVGVRVVDAATLLSISIYPEGPDRVLAKGAQMFFHATGTYDVGFGRDVTADVVWRISDEAVGTFAAGGVLTGRAAGTVTVWAELAGQKSNTISIEVFQQSDLAYCDQNQINRTVWADDFNRVILESDCGSYTAPGVATVRYTVTETQPHGGVFDPCLDLAVYRGDRLVRTMRQDGCGDPFLPAGATERADAVLKYQWLAFWDLKDDLGGVVSPGIYTILGRFYLYYDPIVRIDVAVTSADGRIACVPEACGNGCGYVHRCGDDGPPGNCPAVCVPLCACPPGWGMTAAGDCELCPGECCPAGAACGPSVPPCAPVCCETGRACVPELPPCEVKCCPAGAACEPLNLPPCLARE